MEIEFLLFTLYFAHFQLSYRHMTRLMTWNTKNIFLTFLYPYTHTHIDSHLFLFIKIVFPPHYLPFKTCLKLKTLKSQWQKWQNRTERGCKLKEIWGFSYLIVVVCCYSVTYTHFPQKMMTFLCFSFLLWKRRHENVVYFHHHRVEFSVTVTGFVWKKEKNTKSNLMKIERIRNETTSNFCVTFYS